MQKLLSLVKKNKRLIVSVAVAVLVAIPVLAQPLGLALPFTAPVAETNKAQATVALNNEATTTLDPLESLDNLDIDMDRSMDETEADLAALAENGADIDGNELMDDLVGEEPAVEPTETQPTEIAPVPTETTPAPTEPADPIADVAAHTAYVTKSGVNLRTEPSTDSAALAQLSMGAKLTVTGEMTGWKRVKEASGREGYVADEFISRAMVFVPHNDTVYVTKSGVNLRKEPTTSSASLGLLGLNVKLTRTGIGDGWTRVSTATGKVGYIASSFLTTTAPPKPTAAPTPKPTSTTAPKPTTAPAPKPTGVSSSIAKVIDTAYSMLGVPYVFGSESRSGVDCSGLILYCYKQIGVSVPRTSASYASFGTAVSYENMKPGDVIALDTRKNDGKRMITHVGIYVGGGNMIHASSSLDKVVKANVANYLKYSTLITIRRIVN